MIQLRTLFNGDVSSACLPAFETAIANHAKLIIAQQTPISRIFIIKNVGQANFKAHFTCILTKVSFKIIKMLLAVTEHLFVVYCNQCTYFLST
ncbi:hypothetical protein LFAB_08000 [Lactiplantibacillus fabifermentans T30PCM01]|uniref:Uncharacterized protein n=2 Tax=Lactiplantibacillus fabifermentans TaxID=483011 RepID=A0A0R2NG85_9LACO|nr:hypothetical protein LFAB_08000 [Lactiplantibacillus fabifermentans T30PCM01]KRO24831.1 hypothetical protein DY78_GL001559 [Lactiplantibacillus fabifermentans DSM 21115]